MSDRAEEALPGADLVARGVLDLERGERTVEALLVARAATRLRATGIAVPHHDVTQPDVALYRLLAAEEGNAAHARYNALTRRLVSFCAAREHATRR